MASAVQARTDEDLSELRRRVRRFVDDELVPLEPVLDGDDDRSAAAMAGLKALAKERGIWALGHPASIGGGGLPFLDYVMINEIVGRSYWANEALGTLSFQDCLMLLEFGSDEQKAQWVPLLFEGVTYPSIGMTEPEVAGSDPTLIQTTAVLDGDEWVINGHKWFTSGANHAAYTAVFARTDPEAPKHQQFSVILVPTDTPGYNIQRVVRTMGHYGGNHCEVRYDNVRVPARNLIGPRGGGFAVTQTRLGPGRITHCMRWLGQAQRAFELMCDRAGTRFAHGSLLAEKGEIQRYIAESAAQIQAARLMTLDAARAIDAGRDARVEISLIKFFGAQMLHDVIDRAMQVHGAMGVTEDTPLERMYRDARYARIYDGPDEVHRMVVAKRLLRTYKDAAPWSDVIR
jgi:alkylation response protein AidB-like acyl-CoA dehydrogenase